jgi:predicted DNA-binding protein
MTSTLTIRLPLAQRETLRTRAKALRTTESGYIRAMLERDLATVSYADLVQDHAGTVDSSRPVRPAHPDKAGLRRRNARA